MNVEVEPEKFPLFGAAHLAVMLATVILPVILSFFTLRHKTPERVGRLLAFSLVSVLFANWLFMLARYFPGKPWPELLPMHLCDWATIVVAAALITRRQFWYNLAYLWGLAGTMQAVVTPDIRTGLYDIRVLMFFVGHCGIIVGVLYLTWGLKLRPYFPRSLVRAFWAIQLYAVAGALVNWLAGTNYGYLAGKPRAASLLDLLAPWPWYLLQMELLALLSFLIYYAPFAVSDVLRGRRGGHLAGRPSGNALP